MKKLRLYLDTSVWNFMYADDAPEKRDVTKIFFQQVCQGWHDAYISDVVLLECGNAPAEKSRQLLQLIESVQPTRLMVSEDARRLAASYIEAGVVPEQKLEDALHVAVATFHELDAVITWNFHHLANLRKKEFFHAVNLREGYFKPLELVTPLEVSVDESR